jgi:alkylation response protein AidB-like acyl-CoA dehydrogenase
MDAAEQAMLAASLREVLRGDAAAVPALLDDLGWNEVMADDPAIATRLLFAEHGRALARTTLLDELVLDALADVLPQRATAVWWPAGDIGVVMRALTEADIVTIPSGISILVVPAGELQTVPVRTIDAELDWYQVTRPDGDGVEAPNELEMAGATAHRALAAELIALSEEILRLAVEHTSTREQFGAPISTFQAVRHQLADAHVSITAAAAVLDAAFADGTAVSAMAAKAQAGRTHQLVSANATQVCGAMGSTYEHPLHRYIARGVALDAILGSWDALSAELGTMLMKEKTPPRLVEV